MKKDLAAAYSAKRMKSGGPKLDEKEDDFLTADMEDNQLPDLDNLFVAPGAEDSEDKPDLHSIVSKLRKSRIRG